MYSREPADPPRLPAVLARPSSHAWPPPGEGVLWTQQQLGVSRAFPGARGQRYERLPPRPSVLRPMGLASPASWPRANQLPWDVVPPLPSLSLSRTAMNPLQGCSPGNPAGWDYQFSPFSQHRPGVRRKTEEKAEQRRRGWSLARGTRKKSRQQSKS